MLPDFTGEFAGLAAAFAWAVAAILFRQLGATIPPFALNLYKGVLAAAMLLVVIAARRQAWPDIYWWPVVLLVVSGVIGIGIGDTAFFAALNRLGERRTVLMAETLSPPLAALLAFAALAEVLSPLATFGIAITITR